MIWVGIAIGIYLTLLVVIAIVSLRPPRIPVFLSPGSLGASQEDVSFKSQDGLTITGWWVEAPGAKTVAVLAHGYVMNRSELTPVAFQLWKRGVSCLLLDFRAHGLTKEGSSTLGLAERWDVIAGVEYAKSRLPGAKVVLIGSSMGSAASALAMGENPDLADALVLDSCYSRLSGATIGWWRFLGGWPLAIFLAPTALVAVPVVRVNPFKVDISRALKNVPGEKVLILHGGKDTLATPKEARRNVDAAGEGSEIVWFEGCSHSEFRWLEPERYYDALFAFLRKRRLLD